MVIFAGSWPACSFDNPESLYNHVIMFCYRLFVGIVFYLVVASFVVFHTVAELIAI